MYVACVEVSFRVYKWPVCTTTTILNVEDTCISILIMKHNYEELRLVLIRRGWATDNTDMTCRTEHNRNVTCFHLT